MVHVTYVDFKGTKRGVNVPEGTSVMEAAVNNHIPGIDGDCGGAGACATCHCYVEPEWLAKTPPANELERNMLKFVLEPNAQSRLACQIKLNPDLDGMVVRTPERQY